MKVNFIFSLTIINGIGSLIYQIAIYLGFAYASRELSIENYGFLILASTISGYFVIFTNFGLNLHGAREYLSLDKVRKIEAIVGIINAKLILASICIICLLLYYQRINASDQIIFNCLLIYSIEILLAIINFEWINQSQRQFVRILYSKIIYLFAFSILILFFIFILGFDIYSLPVAQVLSNVLMCLYLINYKKEDLSIEINLRKGFFYILKTKNIFFSIVINYAMFTYGILLLGYLEKTASAGLLGAIVRLVLLIAGLSGAYYTIIYSETYKLYIERNTYVDKIFKRSFDLSLLCGLSLFLIFILRGIEIMMLIYGRNLIFSNTSIYLMACLLLINFINTPFGKFILCFGLEKKLFKSLLIALIFGLASSIFLVPYLEING